MKKFEFKVGEKFNNYKTIDFLKGIGISSVIIQKIKFSGVYINERKINNVNERVEMGNKVKIVLPEDEGNSYVVPILGKLNILFEDDYLLAVVKERGMLTHCSKSNNQPALDQLVCGYFLPNKFTFRAINRLDRDTSGIVLIAKDMLTASLLGEQMKKGLIKKTYWATVVGKPIEKHFFIEKPIKRQNQNSMIRVCAPDGKYAKTECTVIKQLEENKCILEIDLHTGRTHQIRVHLASIGLPLYADNLYGTAVENETYSLCAKKLKFTHPFTGEELLLVLN